jgi:hypothetical protein
VPLDFPKESIDAVLVAEFLVIAIPAVASVVSICNIFCVLPPTVLELVVPTRNLPDESIVNLCAELVERANVLAAERNAPLAGALAVPVKFNACTKSLISWAFV